MSPQFTVGTTLGTGMAYLFTQVAAEGVSTSVWTQLGIIGAGVSVFLYQEKKHNGLRREADTARRALDDVKDSRIKELEAEVRGLYERIAKSED